MMKSTFALFLVLAVALIGIAPSVSLAEYPSNYMVLKGGLYSPSKDFNLDNVLDFAVGTQESATTGKVYVFYRQ